MTDIHFPHPAIIEQRVQESSSIFTLRLQFTDRDRQAAFEFVPGQFNMLSLFGIGEVPMSIINDPEDSHFFDHTIRVVGRVTRGLDKLQPGDQVGIRGPFGRGWPTEQAVGQDVLLVTGGLGCAPLVSVIHYLLRRREKFGQIHILQGVKHADDLIWRERYEAWSNEHDVNVLLAADIAGQSWPWQQGQVTELLDLVELRLERTIAMLCGPELMMMAAIAKLRERGLSDDWIWLSMERNMQCGFGQCGHCQVGPKFSCKDGPVFCYSEIADLFGAKGF